MSWICWNCENKCPEIQDVGFQFVAVEVDEEWHPVCATCAKLTLETAAGPVTMYQQVKKNLCIRVTP